jgi:oligoendopeptidase F
MIQVSSLPATALELAEWQWSQIKAEYDALAERELNASNVEAWLADWTRLTELVSEAHHRLYVATSVNTADERGHQRYKDFLDNIYTPSHAAEQKLKEKLLATGLTPTGFELPLRNMRAEAALFREKNLPLLAQEQKLETEYEKITGAQTVIWDGEEIPLLGLIPKFQDPDRATRERAHRAMVMRFGQDRRAINELWREFLRVRRQLAANAGFDNPKGSGDYRDYRWQQLLRFDYTPDDCKQFQESIAEVVVPVASRLYEKGRAELGVDTLKPWDLTGLQGFGRVVSPPDEPVLHPYDDISELEAKCANIFQRMDPQLGAYFETMRRENLLDLPNRKDKAPGAYCIVYEASRRPFIFANSVGTDGSVQALLHEGGHAFHAFESSALPYFQQRAEQAVPMEFSEVASTGMEFLAAPYLAAREGGFYSDVDAARAQRSHLQSAIHFWPYMALVDAFQHWVYENVETAMDIDACDTEWEKLWRRFMPGVDYSGFEEAISLRWQMQGHIIGSPFYYVEYGLAQLGAVQVWANALKEQAGAVANYRRALALGGTATLPELYAAAGAKFTFDKETLRDAVTLMERTIDELDRV